MVKASRTMAQESSLMKLKPNDKNTQIRTGWLA